MNEREFENKLYQLLGQDFSKGTEEFRDALLAQCLEALDKDSGVTELDDAALEMLAAAGENFEAPTYRHLPSENTGKQIP